MNLPASTYRVQLHKGFSFTDLKKIVGYLHKLGVSTIYAAPILKSRPGSLHGYDVIDPHAVDAEIGTVQQLTELSNLLASKKMSWLQDIVPNHMAFDVGNERLMDVLERGPASPYYYYFDIDWDHHDDAFRGKVCVPFLGKTLQECIASGEIRLSFSERGFGVVYFDTTYPLSISVLERFTEGLPPAAADLVTQARSSTALADWREGKSRILNNLWNDPSARTMCETWCAQVNADHTRLARLLEAQFYLLTYWKDSETRINYRRFFTVNELICIRIEDDAVFDEYHRFIHSLYKDKVVSGVRIDHIDGLHDPSRYVHKLRRLFGDQCYIIAEKILEAKEDMPGHWPLEGTSGYEFLSYTSQLMTWREGARKLVAFYHQLVPGLPPYHRLVYQNKKLILEQYMAGEWDNLTEYLFECGLGRDHSRERIRQAIAAFMLAFPVYRIYPESLPLSKREAAVVEEAFRHAFDAGQEYEGEIAYLKSLFLGPWRNETEAKNALRFMKRLMQFTGPLTAKGVEDTTFYVYNPLISHDEVGDAPSTLGISVNAFHAKMAARMKSTPYSLNATATHDTKRGEDSRLRLNVLSEIPDEWIAHVKQWKESNAGFKKDVGGVSAPSDNDEYFIYQSLLGGYEPEADEEQFFERFNAFLTKAIREAKVHSNWSEPNEEYEKACHDFSRNIFRKDHAFLETFLPFLAMVSRYAALYSLAQTLIKITSPGIPDIYQGCELWDFSFVDPDNRRPVDFDARARYLDEIESATKGDSVALFRMLRSRRHAGYEKLFVTWKALTFRRDHPQLFSEGEYIALPVNGPDGTAIAYARTFRKEWIVVAVPLSLARNRETDQPYAQVPDENMYISLPTDAPASWTNVFSGEKSNDAGKITIFDAFKDFPVAMFYGRG